MKVEVRAYIWLIDLIIILRNDPKDCKKTIIKVFGIKVDISNFLARLLKEKIDKAVKATKKILKKKFVSFTDMQLLVGFLSFCSQVVNLEQVFMQRLWDFINQYLCSAAKISLRRTLAWVRENLE